MRCSLVDDSDAVLAGLELDGRATVSDASAKIESLLNIPARKQVLFFEGLRLKASERLGEIGVPVEGGTLKLFVLQCTRERRRVAKKPVAFADVVARPARSAVAAEGALPGGDSWGWEARGDVWVMGPGQESQLRKIKASVGAPVKFARSTPPKSCQRLRCGMKGLVDCCDCERYDPWVAVPHGLFSRMEFSRDFLEAVRKMLQEAELPHPLTSCRGCLSVEVHDTKASHMATKFRPHKPISGTLVGFRIMPERRASLAAQGPGDVSGSASLADFERAEHELNLKLLPSALRYCEEFRAIKANWPGSVEVWAKEPSRVQLLCRCGHSERWHESPVEAAPVSRPVSQQGRVGRSSSGPSLLESRGGAAPLAGRSVSATRILARPLSSTRLSGGKLERIAVPDGGGGERPATKVEDWATSRAPPAAVPTPTRMSVGRFMDMTKPGVRPAWGE